MARQHVAVSHSATNSIALRNIGDATTYVNGMRLSSDTEQELQHGDRIALGCCSHVFLLINPTTIMEAEKEAHSALGDRWACRISFTPSLLVAYSFNR